MVHEKILIRNIRRPLEASLHSSIWNTSSVFLVLSLDVTSYWRSCDAQDSSEPCYMTWSSSASPPLRPGKQKMFAIIAYTNEAHVTRPGGGCGGSAALWQRVGWGSGKQCEIWDIWPWGKLNTAEQNGNGSGNATHLDCIGHEWFLLVAISD